MWIGVNKMIKWILKILAWLFGSEPEPTPDPVIPDPVIPDPEKLKTVQKVLLWMESGAAKLEDITNSKRCSMNPHDVIITDTKMDLKATKEVQNAGGLVALCVHPWYSPWNKGMTESLKLVKEYAKYYDYIALDYEGPLANADFAKRLQQFGKPLIIVPMARDDAMNEYYEGLAGIEGAIFAWWNYSSGLVAWVKFFKDYEFRPSCKHAVLLSIGNKYIKYVSDEEIKNIIVNLDNIRAGSFSPKNDYETFRTMRSDLIKIK